MGVNTFLSKDGSPTIIPAEVIRATEEEKVAQIHTVENVQLRGKGIIDDVLVRLQQTAISNGNLFDELMETSKHCTLGQVTNALYEVGGKYRRNM